jgi:hypothetical protein
MEKWPEENNNLTKKEKWCVLAAWAAVFWLMCITIPFQKNEARVDSSILYWLPWLYWSFIITMFIYGSIIKNK